MNFSKFFTFILLSQICAISGAQDVMTLDDGTKLHRLKDGSLFSGEIIEGQPHGQGSEHTLSSREISVGRWNRGSKEGFFFVISKVREPLYRLFQSDRLVYETQIRIDFGGKSGYRAGSKGLRWKVYDLEHFEEINFYDDKNIGFSNGIKNVWELTDFVSPQDGIFYKSALSRMSNVELNCKKSQIRAISAHWFSERQRAGRVLNTARYEQEGHPDSKWQQVIPQTTLESLFKIVCKK
jgi:hypothetical protein